MQLDRPLQVISPTVDGDVLAALARTDAAFTGRGLHRVIGRHSADGVRRAVERLARQGIVDVAVAGPSKLYSLNRDHLAAPYIVALASLREQLVDRLRQHLAAWDTPPAYAAMFGSAIGGQMRADSDVDVFVVRPAAVAPDDGRWTRQLAELAHAGSRWTGNDLRIFEMSEPEARIGAVQDEHVLEEISGHGISLAGSEDFLRTSRGRQARRATDHSRQLTASKRSGR